MIRKKKVRLTKEAIFNVLLLNELCRGVVLSLSFGAPYWVGIEDSISSRRWTRSRSNSFAPTKGSPKMLDSNLAKFYW